MVSKFITYITTHVCLENLETFKHLIRTQLKNYKKFSNYLDAVDTLQLRIRKEYCDKIGLGQLSHELVQKFLTRIKIMLNS